MFKNFSIAAFVTAALFAILPAQATVLTFNNQTFGNYATFTEQAYTVSHTNSYNGAVGNTGYCSPSCPYNGTNYLLAVGSVFTIAATDGSAFSLTGFDGAETFANLSGLWATSIVVTGTKVDGSTVSQSFLLDGIDDGLGALVDFQSFIATGLTNLSSVTFSGSNRNYFSLDNISLSPYVAATATAAVPEPGSVALLGLGLFGFMVARRKQK